jgi:hypothetical protein
MLPLWTITLNGLKSNRATMIHIKSCGESCGWLGIAHMMNMTKMPSFYVTVCHICNINTLTAVMFLSHYKPYWLYYGSTVIYELYMYSIPILVNFLMNEDMSKIHNLLDSKGISQWCITHKISVFLDFFHRPLL